MGVCEQQHWKEGHLGWARKDMEIKVANQKPDGLISRAVAGVSLHVCVSLGPVLASHAPSLPAAAAATWRGRGQIPMSGWSYGRVGPERGLPGGGRRGWCEKWARRGKAHLTSLVLGPLNSLVWYVPSSRYIWSSAPILFLQQQIKDIIIVCVFTYIPFW